jgi:hypothetical protein
MAVQGLDRATAPPAATAKQMLDEIGGRWWNVYIGGPESGGHGWTPALVGEYIRHGIDRFMLTYVGRQHHGPLTRGQGQADALDALGIAEGFGYTGDFPLCLDVELRTFESAPAKAVEYTRAWCATVRDRGARPGVYANAVPLKAMAKGNVPADFVWVASWVSHGPAKHDPHAIPNLPPELWSRQGQRAWQYAGAFDNKPCRVLGLDVDINVADLGCLAQPPGVQQAAHGPRVLRRGDEGVRVQRLTRRLSFVRSQATRAPYLDGARRRFDRETEAAVKAFQREHGLADSGRFGSRTAEKLSRAVAQEKERRKQDGGGVPVQANVPVGSARRDLAALVGRALRTDDRHDEAFEDLLAYGLRRRRQLKRAVDERGSSTEGLLSKIVEILLRIEDDVEELGEPEEKQPAVTTAPPAANAPAEAEPAVAGTATAPQAVSIQPSPPGATAALPQPEPNGNTAADTAAALAAMSDRALARLIREHDAAIGVARGVLVERFAGYEAELARLGRLGGPGGGKVTSGGGKVTPAGGGKVTPGGGKVTPGGGKVTPGGGKVIPGAGKETPGKGSVADIRLGDQAHVVRASKIALARFLAAKGTQEHVPLRRTLRREALVRKRGEIATQTWQNGVRAAQHLSGQRATGVMDGELQKTLQRHWPSDSALRRLMRGTPAWRLIKGQVSPNFNLREFACKDGTPYVTGLVREQGLTKEQAKKRARELAKRLERVRKADGDRKLTLTSVYRTVAHNARQPGAVKNSSHLRGFAADIPAPAGVSLETHHKHVRAAFEAGVGFYPPPHGSFVHGDFDTNLGLARNW